MGARGRKSQNQLAPLPLQVIERPKPPADLTDEQAQEWNQIAARMPADWFGVESHALLAQYCRHICNARRVAQLIAAVEQPYDVLGQALGISPSDDVSAMTFDVKRYDQLLKMQERETRALASLAVKLRISQSTYYDKSKKKGSSAPKPWDS